MEAELAFSAKLLFEWPDAVVPPLCWMPEITTGLAMGAFATLLNLCAEFTECRLKPDTAAVHNAKVVVGSFMTTFLLDAVGGVEKMIKGTVFCKNSARGGGRKRAS